MGPEQLWGNMRGLAELTAEGPVVGEVEPREGDMAGIAGREVKGGEPRAQSDGGMTGLLCCKMVRGEVQCTEELNDGTEDI